MKRPFDESPPKTVTPSFRSALAPGEEAFSRQQGDEKTVRGVAEVRAKCQGARAIRAQKVLCTTARRPSFVLKVSSRIGLHMILGGG